MTLKSRIVITFFAIFSASVSLTILQSYRHDIAWLEAKLGDIAQFYSQAGARALLSFSKEQLSALSDVTLKELVQTYIMDSDARRALKLVLRNMNQVTASATQPETLAIMGIILDESTILNVGEAISHERLFQIASKKLCKSGKLELCKINDFQLPGRWTENISGISYVFHAETVHFKRQESGVIVLGLPLNNLTTEKQLLLKKYLFLGGGAIILSSLLLYLILKYSFGPLGRLRSALLSIIRSREIHSGAIVKAQKHDEVGEVIDAFNTMVGVLVEAKSYMGNQAFQRSFDKEPVSKAENREISAMFLDFQNFTAFSERVPLKTLEATLNMIFDELSRIIADNGGIVNKYIGDSIFAFFLDEEKCSLQAIKAAKDISAGISASLNAKLTSVWPDFRVRIGVATGPAILCELGSSHKRELTVLGSTVNLASRLESLGKSYPQYDTLVCETTHKYAVSLTDKFPSYLISKNTFALIKESIAIRGLKAPTTVYGILR